MRPHLTHASGTDMKVASLLITCTHAITHTDAHTKKLHSLWQPPPPRHPGEFSGPDYTHDPHKHNTNAQR